MTVIVLATHCISCQHSLKINADWCPTCKTDEYIVNDIELKDRSK